MLCSMKKSAIAISFLVLMAIFASPVSASAAAKAGIKPGSFFYFFDTAFEKIGLFFTFNPEKKAQKAMEYAEEKLAEAEAAANENKPEAVATAMANYQNDVSFATNESKTIEDKIKAENLLSIIADNTSKHQEVLAEVLNKVPDEAKEAIIKAIEVSKKGQEEAMKQIAELKGEVEQLKQAVAELKAKDENQTKTIEELGKQKSENVSVPVKSSTSQSPTKAVETKSANITTLPNGTVVEMDINGNVIRTIKEAQQQTHIAPDPIIQIQNTLQQIQQDIQKIQQNAMPLPLVPEGDKSEIFVEFSKIVDRNYCSIPDMPCTPYGEYEFKICVLDKSGKSIKDVVVKMGAPDNDVLIDSQNKEKEIYNTLFWADTWRLESHEHADGKLWGVAFRYRPQTSGTKTIIFTSGNLSKSITIDVTEVPKI